MRRRVGEKRLFLHNMIFADWLFFNWVVALFINKYTLNHPVCLSVRSLCCGFQCLPAARLSWTRMFICSDTKSSPFTSNLNTCAYKQVQRAQKRGPWNRPHSVLWYITSLQIIQNNTIMHSSDDIKWKILKYYVIYF